MINIDNAAARFASILAAMVRAVESSPSGVTLARMVESLQGEGIEVTEDDVRAVGVLSTGVLESRQRAGFVLAGKEKASQAVNKGVRKEAQKKEGRIELIRSLLAAGVAVGDDLLGEIAAFEADKARKAG